LSFSFAQRKRFSCKEESTYKEKALSHRASVAICVAGFLSSVFTFEKASSTGLKCGD
jgi:hypothetical protein